MYVYYKRRMASFNTQTYDSTSVVYNILDQTYIDGSNCIPINGTTYYPNLFGNVMCSFFVDGGDSILGGNTIITRVVSSWVSSTWCSFLKMNW